MWVEGMGPVAAICLLISLLTIPTAVQTPSKHLSKCYLSIPRSMPKRLARQCSNMYGTQKHVHA